MRRFWINPAFLRLWTGQVASQFGSQVTLLALPLTAALMLGASPLQMGLLGFVQYLPFALVSLAAGVWSDRGRRRRLLVGADVGRGLLLLIIPAAALLGQLRLVDLYVVAFAVGVLTVIFEVTYPALLPSLVERERLVDANSRLSASTFAAQVAGPGLGGALVQLATAPIAIVVNAATFLVSAVLLRSLPEPTALRGRPPSRIRDDLWEGIRAVTGSPTLRAILLWSFTSNFAVDVNLAISVLFMARVLELQPALIGLVYASNSLGAVTGSLLAPYASRWLGLGRALVLAQVLSGLGALAAALPFGPPPAAAAELAVALLAWGVGGGLQIVNSTSLRQEITPDHLQGRVTATTRFVSWGLAPTGFLVGGALGQTLGLRPTVAVAGLGVLAATVWLLASPIRAARQAQELVITPRPGS